MFLEKIDKKGFLEKENIQRAFKKINRKDFVSEKMKGKAHLDRPLPIGKNQTISQPSVVAFMLDWLDPREGDKILDIGSGSGWTTALLAEAVGPEGKVFGLEKIPELKEFGEENTKKYNFVESGRVDFIVGDGYEGLSKKQPFDKILVSATLPEEEIPKAWKSQLKKEGVVVTPIKNSIVKLKKKDDGFNVDKKHGFRFVPLVKEE